MSTVEEPQIQEDTPCDIQINIHVISTQRRGSKFLYNATKETKKKKAKDEKSRISLRIQ